MIIPPLFLAPRPLAWFVLRALTVLTASSIVLAAVATRASAQSVFKSLLTFDPTTQGAHPFAGLAQGGDGNFYGVCIEGGANNTGTVFRLTAGGGFTVLHTFSALDGNNTNADGANPYGTLLLAHDGFFYGTTANGGAHNSGTIFRLKSDGTLTTLYSFSTRDQAGPNFGGSFPQGQLIQGSDGSLLGTATYGGNANQGTVFRFTPCDGILTALHNFSAFDAYQTNVDGAYPMSGLFQAADGRLYGAAFRGGIGGSGTIFSLTEAGDFTPLYAFAPERGDTLENSDGRLIRSVPVLGRDGNFYGVASAGGTGGSGTIYRLNLDGSKLTTLHSFSTFNSLAANADGALPAGGLVASADGFFYGTTEVGGTNGTGLVFKVSPGGMLTTLHTFAAADDTRMINSDGTRPSASMIQARDGAFYGTTYFGGPEGAGAIFRVVVSPAITNARSVQGRQGMAFSYQITAANGATGYLAANLPPGLSLNSGTGKISGTPSKAGTYTATIAATNAAGRGSTTIIITVAASTKPVITSAATASATVGKAFGYQITATHSPTKYGAAGLPSGLSINQTTGKISGTPTKAGTYNATIAAFNASGSGSAKLTLTVK